MSLAVFLIAYMHCDVESVNTIYRRRLGLSSKQQ